MMNLQPLSDRRIAAGNLIATALTVLIGLTAASWFYPVGLIVVLCLALAVALAVIWRAGGDRRRAMQGGATAEAPQPSSDHKVSAPRLSGASRTIGVFTMPQQDETASIDVNWATFGMGVERLKEQIKNYGHFEVQACIGINDAGLVMATFLGSASLGSPSLGYIRYTRSGPAEKEIHIGTETILPTLEQPNPTLLLADFEIKSGKALRGVVEHLRSEYQAPRIYLAAFGAQAENADGPIRSTNELTAAPVLRELEVELFVACTMGDPGIEPPLMLR